MVANFLFQHNIALLTADHITLLLKEGFPNSKITKKYASRRRKTVAMINKSFALHCLDYIVEHCESHLYSVGTNGSNDASTEKMNLLNFLLSADQKQLQSTL